MPKGNKLEGLSLQDQILANLGRLQPNLAAAFSDSPRRTAETVRSTSARQMTAPTHSRTTRSQPTAAEYIRTQTERSLTSGKVDQTSHRSLRNHEALKDSSFSPCADEECSTCGPVEKESDSPPFRTFNKVRQESLTHEVPTKKYTKARQKLTKGTKGQFNRAALQGVPGGGLKGNFAIMRMIDAEGTGCRVAEDMLNAQGGLTAYESLQERLGRSAKNCNTTTGNYSPSYTDED